MRQTFADNEVWGFLGYTGSSGFLCPKGYFRPGVCRAPEGEETPEPLEGECVVYWDFFVARLRFPVDPVLPEIFARFGLNMHRLTPNAIMQL